MLNCHLHQSVGTEQEQKQNQHWDKCLVPHLPAVLGWNLTSQGQKGKGTCLANSPALLVLLTHPQGLRPAPRLGQGQQ